MRVVTAVFNETTYYYAGNRNHHGKKRIYVTNRREQLRLLHDGKIHVFAADQCAEFIGEAKQAGHGRLKVLCEEKKIFADNAGLYRLA
ncbi:hypothetical protein V1502_17015 [Bacillus sp. SCS-153A]|uniref:hypothetical protein n=1 Tax=Rossellomorea sedimentorum TaxID=3115294 RepID=UPI003905A625